MRKLSANYNEYGYDILLDDKQIHIDGNHAYRTRIWLTDLQDPNVEKLKEIKKNCLTWFNDDWQEIGEFERGEIRYKESIVFDPELIEAYRHIQM